MTAAAGVAALTYGISRPRISGVRGWPELVEDFAPWGFAAAPALAVAAGARGSRVGVAANVAAMAVFASTWGRRYLRRGGKSPSDFTVMTFNVLHSNAHHHATAASIMDQGADLVALQEVTDVSAEAIDRLVGWSFPYRYFRPAERAAGAALLSRFPLENVEEFRLSGSGHWCLRADLVHPSARVTVLNVHTVIPRARISLSPPDASFDSSARRDEVLRLSDLTRKIHTPLLVLGDFNMTERSFEHRVLSEHLRDAYLDVGRGLGHTFPRLGSFPRSMPAPWPMLRLDHIFHSGQLKAAWALTGDGGGSDHLPVVAGFRVARERRRAA
ncbi:MAG: endonuclease/exonuclease/phosphatase family protein [Chloroflexota bacterium]